MNPPKMPIHIGDYQRDTGHLRAAQHGAYLLLLFHHWSTGSLPNDDDQLAAIARMDRKEWKKARPLLEKFFRPGWVHGRVVDDLAAAKESYEKLAAAGAKGGKAKARLKRRSSEATSIATGDDTASLNLPLTLDQKKDSVADATGAVAPVDHRKRLFDEGLPKLARMTGKGPDACRSFVGKCLKAAGDDAVTVLGLIEDAERNQAVDPSAWIAARLKNNQPPQGNSNGRRSVHDAANDLLARVRALDEPAPRSLCDGEGEGSVRLLPPR